MEYTRPGRAGDIRAFWPDDTETAMYVADNATLEEILLWTQEKWPGVSVKELRITPEHVQTDCLGYTLGDQYDPNDYTNFLKIERLPHPEPHRVRDLMPSATGEHYLFAGEHHVR